MELNAKVAAAGHGEPARWSRLTGANGYGQNR